MWAHSSKGDLPEIASFIHQAALAPHLNEDLLNQNCDLASHFTFSGLCTNLSRIPYTRERLGPPGPTKLIAVIAFPFGAIPSSFKKAEAEWAASKGAEQLDVVPNYFALTQGQTNFFAEELATLCSLGLPVRVILDLTNIPSDQLTIAIEAALDAGVRGLQSGNGFGPAVTPNQISELAQLARGRCEIKAVGGIKTLTQALKLIDAGATQLGTSFGQEIMQEIRDQKE